jgi:ribonuclease P protein component
MEHTFHRAERLKSEKIINNLFKGGRSFSCYPLRLVWSESVVETPVDAHPITKSEPFFPVQFSLSVPKRAFKRAHDRNLLRRRVRESYRLHKHNLYDLLKKPALESHKNKQFSFMVLYTAKEILPYGEIERGVKKMIFKFGKELELLK